MQAVDLGLSVKWADRNLDATSPYDMGGLSHGQKSHPKKNIHGKII